MSRLMGGLSLVLSIAALAVAVASYRAADEKAQEAVRQRERLLIERLNPKLQRIYADFRLKESPHGQNPDTVEEMIEPLIRLSEPPSTRPAALQSPTAQPAAVSSGAKLIELVAHLNDLPVRGSSFGGPYVGIAESDETQRIIAHGESAVPTLIAGLANSNYAGSVYMVYCLRKLRAAGAKEAVRSLKNDLGSGRRTFVGKHDMTLDVEIDAFLKQSEEW